MNNKKVYPAVKYLQARQSEYLFCIDESKWKLDKNHTINIEDVLHILSPKLIEGYLNTLAFYACNYSPAYVLKINYNMRDFLKKTSSVIVLESDILNYKASLSEINMQKLIILRCFFKKWHSIGYYGVDDNTIILLKSMRLKAKTPGAIIKQEDPNQGALTDKEHKTLNLAMHNAYKSKKITHLEFSLALLVSLTGRRSTQIIALKFKDIIKETFVNGDDGFFLNFPRVKQGVSFRHSFRMLSIDAFLYNTIIQQANYSISLIENNIGRSLMLEEKNEVPVFLDNKKYKTLSGSREDFYLLTSDRLHESATIVSLSLKKIVEEENVISERTGDCMKVNPYRLRYTLGTRLAHKGYSVQVIAELLDHSSTSSAGIYIENLPDNAIKINGAVSNNLAFLADVFLGKAKINESINNKKLLTSKGCSSWDSYSKAPCNGCVYFEKFK